MMYAMTSFVMVFWFYFALYELILSLIQQYKNDIELDRKEELLKQSIEKEAGVSHSITTPNKQPLIEINNSDQNSEFQAEEIQATVPYIDRLRTAGCGPLRIGVDFRLYEDLYSLLFIANVRKEYHLSRVQTARKKTRAFDKLLN